MKVIIRYSLAQFRQPFCDAQNFTLASDLDLPWAIIGKILHKCFVGTAP